MGVSQYSNLARLMGTAEANVTVANTTTLTELGSAVTIPANMLAQGAIIKGVAAGAVSTTGTPTINFGLQVGGTTVLATGALTTGSGLSAVGWVLHYYGTVLTVGATGTIMFALEVVSDDAGVHFAIADTTADTVDTTVDEAVRIVVTWGTASASNTITCSQHILETMGC